MKMKLVFSLFLLSVFVGCRDNRVTGDVEHELDVMIPKIGVEYTPPLWKNLFDKVNACTNAADRLACHKCIFERFHSIRFVVGDFRRQERIFVETDEFSSFHPWGKNGWGMPLEALYGYYLRHLGWMRAQLEILKPTREINRSKMTVEECKEWERWRDTYLYCKDFYEMRLGMFEKHYARDFKDYNVSAEERVRIEKQITDFLGRPIRSPGQVDADRKAASQSPEMRAIWRGEVGPAKFARDSDSPVEFPPVEVPVCETNAAAHEVDVDI